MPSSTPAKWLDRLLQRVEMDDEAVRVEQLDQARAVAAHLGRAQVGEQQRRPRGVSGPVGTEQSRILEQLPAGAEHHPDPELRRGAQKRRVDLCRLRGAARHRGHEQRRRQRASEQRALKPDVGEVALRQRAVAQPQPLEAGRARVLHARAGRDTQVLGLAGRGRVADGHRS
jgi:hypothetical protein